MNFLRSAFISAFSGLSCALFIQALLQLFRGQQPPLSWLGLALAAGAPALFFAWLYLGRRARTPRHPLGVSVLSGLGLAVTMTMNWRYPVSTGIIHIWAGLCLLGWFAYLRWYSVFANPPGSALEPGNRLPALELETAAGQSLPPGSLLGKPHVLIFYRGNWCPLCSAQVEEVARNYREIARLGADVALISSQPAGHAARLARRFDAPMRFLRDPGNRAARKLGIEHRWGTPLGLQLMGYGNHTARPTVIITAADGEILYADPSDNYRVRPEPDTFLSVLRAAGPLSD
jgi:peroxiredoxin